MSSCHPVLGPLHTHSHLQGLLPRGHGQSSGALDWTGSPVTCTSWKFTNVPGTIERCLACRGSNSPDLIYHNTGQRWRLDPHGLCPLDGPRVFPFPPSSPGPSHAASWTRKARGDALSPPGTYVLELMTF